MRDRVAMFFLSIASLSLGSHQKPIEVNGTLYLVRWLRWRELSLWDRFWICFAGFAACDAAYAHDWPFVIVNLLCFIFFVLTSFKWEEVPSGAH